MFLKYLKFGSPLVFIGILGLIFIGTEVIRYFIFFTFGKASDTSISKQNFFIQLGLLVAGIVFFCFLKFMYFRLLFFSMKINF